MSRNLQRGGALRAESDRRRGMMQSASAAVQQLDAGSCGQCRLAIGQCSCAGGSRVMMASANPRGIPQGGGGSLVADLGGPPTQCPAGWTCVPPVANGCYPRSICDNLGSPVGWSRAMMEVMAQGKQEPYTDSHYDFANMDILYSDLTLAASTIAAGVTGNIDVSPEQGTFAAFYYRVVGVDPTTQVSQVDWRVTRPSVVGCPSPCNTPGPVLSQFVQVAQESCCGIPVAAFLDKRSESSPLRFTITNNQAAGDLLFQVEVRGYCCSTRVC